MRAGGDHFGTQQFGTPARWRSHGVLLVLMAAARRLQPKSIIHSNLYPRQPRSHESKHLVLRAILNRVAGNLEENIFVTLACLLPAPGRWNPFSGRERVS